MLTIHGYQRTKTANDPSIKKALTVKPFSLINPHAVPRYPVYHEDKQYLYLPKHYGIDKYGEVPSTRDVAETPAVHWTFAGSIRPAQRPVVDSFLLPKPHDGILSLHTGGGKTVCALYIASQLRLPTLVIVHNTFLRDQWEDRIKSFLPKARIGRVQADVCDVADRDVVIVMLQTLSMKELNINVFNPIGLVIVDECHHIASEVFVQALPKVTSRYMLGLSATPDRKDKLMYVIHWFLGPLLYKSDTGDSVDTKVRVEVFPYVNDDPEFNAVVLSSQGFVSVPIMVNKLTACVDRTEWLCRILEDVMDEDPKRQMLVLTDRVDHASAILNTLSDSWKAKTAILSQKLPAAKRAIACTTTQNSDTDTFVKSSSDSPANIDAGTLQTQSSLSEENHTALSLSNVSTSEDSFPLDGASGK
jgi:superfamily II DNA or RNA helicase